MDAWMNFSVVQLVSWGLWCVISFTPFVLPSLEHTIVKEISVSMLVNSYTVYVVLLECGYKGRGNSAATMLSLLTCLTLPQII